jgi:hypothetical protein
MKAKVFFVGRKQKTNSKWPTKEKIIFQLRQFKIFFHENFMDWSLEKRMSQLLNMHTTVSKRGKSLTLR